jgi:hypothetical protein
LTQAEVEAEARRVTKSTDDEEPLEWGTGLKQKQNSADARKKLQEAAMQVC